MTENLIIIKTLADLADLQTALAGKEYIAFDTETTGVEKDAKIIGFSVCADVETGYYVVLSYWDVSTQAMVDLETIHGAKEFLEFLVGKNLVMQNALFDCDKVLVNFGVNLVSSLHTDTMILAHLLDENRSVGLKELGVAIFGETAKDEQIAMKESVTKNGGLLTKKQYELYKGDADLIAKYGAKDAILTLKIFYHLVPELYEQGLDSFFYNDECMPLLKGPTNDLNTIGLRIDPEKLQSLKLQLEADCMEAKAFIYQEILPHVKDKYPGTGKTNVFNIGSGTQLAWLLFHQLGEEFHGLTDEGKNVCKALDIKVPYAPNDKREFIRKVSAYKDQVYEREKFNPKTKKMGRAKKVKDYWCYLSSGKETIVKFHKRYKWAQRLSEYAKNLKLLNTYVTGIQERMKYNIIRPSFLQHGTTSGRYSSRNPNFQNLPRDDKRVKACVVARPGKVFVGADYSQLEPRVFASFSGDERLLNCFKNGEDFYSVIGVEVFDKHGCSLDKNAEDSFAKKYPELRNISKVVALSSTYGTTAHKMAPAIGKRIDEAQEVIDDYFEKFPKVQELMLQSHALAKRDGRVDNLYGRPRRMPKAMDIEKIYGRIKHADLPYEARNMLNLAINHRIQSTGASIMNRAAILCHEFIQAKALEDSRWLEVKIVLQVHDELVLEGPEQIGEEMSKVLQFSMENAAELPGVQLVAEPKIAKNLGDLK